MPVHIKPSNTPCCCLCHGYAKSPCRRLAWGRPPSALQPVVLHVLAHKLCSRNVSVVEAIFSPNVYRSRPRQMSVFFRCSNAKKVITELRYQSRHRVSIIHSSGSVQSLGRGNQGIVLCGVDLGTLENTPFVMHFVVFLILTT